MLIHSSEMLVHGIEILVDGNNTQVKIIVKSIETCIHSSERLVQDRATVFHRVEQMIKCNPKFC